jgi:hypothetical protein
MVQKLLLYVAVWAVMFALFWLAGRLLGRPGAYRRGHEPHRDYRRRRREGHGKGGTP